MAPTIIEQEEGAKASGSRLRRRRRRIPAGFPTPPAVTTPRRATQSESAPPPSQRRKRKRPRATKRRRKRATATGREDEKNAEQEKVEEAAAAAASPPADHAASSGASSVVSSPLRWPSIPRTVIGENAFGEEILEPFHKIDPAIVRAHDRLANKYHAKQDRQRKLASLDERAPPSCMVRPSLLPIRESVTKPILRVAKAVMGLSSYLDGKLLRQTSGFLIDSDTENKTGTILTSALLIQSKSPSIDEWLAKDEYSPHAKVHVHLMDKTDTTVVADLLHYDKHYNLALFKISTNLPAQIPSFTSEQFAEDVFVLGRDKGRNLTIDHGNVVCEGPSIFKRHHYMFISCDINRLGIGGPAINHAGQVVGMFSPQMAFIPSSIILKCLQMWKSFNCIPRLHVGMAFSAIGLLDLPRREKISCKCDVDDGLIVTKVSEGSIAEKLGVRCGDIIKSWNGENISTTTELENFLLDMCKKHLDRGNSIGSSVDLSIGIFHVRNGSHGSIKMTVDASDEVEVAARGIYPVTAADCTSDDDSDDFFVIQGKEAENPNDEDDDIW